MKINYRPSIFLFALLFLGYSCSDREGTASEGNFLLDASEVQNIENEQFLMVTDPADGSVLYWETGLAFEDGITIDTESETVDVTTGVEYSSGFDIKTFRDVQSGFRLSGFTFQCYDGQHDFDPLGLDNVELVISGTTEIIDIYNPLYRQNDLSDVDTTDTEIKGNIIYDYANDLTIIKGRYNRSFKNLQIAMQFSGEDDLKSLIIRKDDWVRIDDENHRIEVQQEDFSSCTLHEIELGTDGGWVMDAEVLTTTGERVTLANWSNQVHTQNGDRIILIVDDRVNLQDLRLSVRNNYTLNGNHFQKHFASIPTSISMGELEVEIIESSNSEYSLATSENSDLVHARYQYKNGNRIFHWSIYQTAASSTSYILPEIQPEYLAEATLMQQVLSSPEYLIVESYDFEEDLDVTYHQTNIDRQLECLDFNSSYLSLEF